MASKIQELDFYAEMEVTDLVTLKDFSTYDVGQCDILVLNHQLFDQTLFRLKVYPNGNCQYNEGYVSVELQLRPVVPYSLTLRCVLSFVDSEGSYRHFQSFTNETDDGMLGLERFAKRKKLLDDNEFVRNDQLTICCNIIYSVSKDCYGCTAPSPDARKIKIRFDPDDEKECLELETQDGGIYRLMFYKGAILKHAICKRSRVFARMFATEMVEKQLKRVVISDVNYNTLKNLIDFVTGEELMLNSVQDIADLYKAADKYEIMELKQECRRDLIKNIIPENASIILGLAHLYSDKQLKNFATLYIQDNLDSVSSSSEWKSLEQLQPELADEAKTVDLSDVIDKLDKLVKEKLGYETLDDKTPEQEELSQLYS